MNERLSRPRGSRRGLGWSHEIEVGFDNIDYRTIVGRSTVDPSTVVENFWTIFDLIVSTEVVADVVAVPAESILRPSPWPFPLFWICPLVGLSLPRSDGSKEPPIELEPFYSQKVQLLLISSDFGDTVRSQSLFPICLRGSKWLEYPLYPTTCTLPSF